jgi:hypothetical protein
MKDFSVANPYTNNLPFPNTKAKVSSPGQNDGTIFNADLVDETLGFHQAALKSAGFTPSGIVDTADSSQILNAIFKHTDDAVDIIEGDITTIEGNITTIEGNITTIEGDISTIEGDITDIKNVNVMKFIQTINGTFTATQSFIDIPLDFSTPPWNTRTIIYAVISSGTFTAIPSHWTNDIDSITLYFNVDFIFSGNFTVSFFAIENIILP